MSASGKHLAQGNPSAVVQAALGVLLHRKAVGLQRGHHLLGGLGAAGGGVAQVVQAGVKATKVVNGVELGGRAHGGHHSVPMRADHHNRARRGQALRQLRHGRTGSAGVQGKSGRAVGHKKNLAGGLHGGWSFDGLDCRAHKAKEKGTNSQILVAQFATMDKLDAMQTFVRVAQAGSFTAVADQLQVARSVVTRQIAALETHLAAKLITRSTRSLTLTAAGSAYLEKCRVILNMVDAAESSLTEENAVPRGRIRLALPHSFGLQRLMPALLDFASAQPHVELLLNFSDQRSNLVEEGIDLAIRITANLQPGDILRQLGSCRLLTVAAPIYLALHGQPKHPAQLQHHECLVYSMSSNTATWPYWVADANGGMGGVSGTGGVNGQVQQFAVRGRLTANNGVALLQATAQGMGIALQPDFLADPFIARQEVVEILQDFASPPLGIYAVLPSNRYIPHRVGVLMDYLAGVLKDADQAAA